MESLVLVVNIALLQQRPLPWSQTQAQSLLKILFISMRALQALHRLQTFPRAPLHCPQRLSPALPSKCEVAAARNGRKMLGLSVEAQTVAVTRSLITGPIRMLMRHLKWPDEARPRRNCRLKELEKSPDSAGAGVFRPAKLRSSIETLSLRYTPLITLLQLMLECLCFYDLVRGAPMKVLALHTRLKLRKGLSGVVKTLFVAPIAPFMPRTQSGVPLDVESLSPGRDMRKSALAVVLYDPSVTFCRVTPLRKGPCLILPPRPSMRKWSLVFRSTL